MELSEEEFFAFTIKSQEQLLSKDGTLVCVFEDDGNIAAVFSIYNFFVEVKTEKARLVNVSPARMFPMHDKYLDEIEIGEFF